MSRRTLSCFNHTIRSRYSRLPDQLITHLAQSGDIYACEYLLYKYRGLVRTKTRPYFLLGAEQDDLLQIGMIGLWQSIMDFSPEKDISFISFARICIERHVITAVKTASRQKQTPLNHAVSLDCYAEEDDSDFDLTEILISCKEPDPEEILIQREEKRRMRETLKAHLSDFEWEVLKRYHFGKSYREIAIDLECSAKSVDNALGRIKRKLAYNTAQLAD